jgi:hypothetical protein
LKLLRLCLGSFISGLSEWVGAATYLASAKGLGVTLFV